MATLATLVYRSTLEKIDVPLDPDEQPMRLFYGRTPRFVQWLQRELPTEPTDLGGRQSPDEQVDDLLHRFISGQLLEEGRDLRSLMPFGSCVWELKTIDVRIFGWFPMRDAFVAVNGGMARRIKDARMYHGYREEVRTVRDRLDLNEPKSVQGSSVSDVLSV